MKKKILTFNSFFEPKEFEWNEWKMMWREWKITHRKIACILNSHFEEICAIYYLVIRYDANNSRVSWLKKNYKSAPRKIVERKICNSKSAITTTPTAAQHQHEFHSSLMYSNAIMQLIVMNVHHSNTLLIRWKRWCWQNKTVQSSQDWFCIMLFFALWCPMPCLMKHTIIFSNIKCLKIRHI